MPTITTPDGDKFDETNPVALNYYRREHGYTVDDTDPGDGLPAKSAPKSDWLDYARAHGYDGDDNDVTKADLIASYGTE